ncbi:hypothetical protein BC827DRAFT_1246954 [Russula dissimulans]|nr:hypothetical protein BC827DRAFT_1246954 [Russula dissimulans]
MKAFLISGYTHHSEIPFTLDAPDPVLEKVSDGLLIDVQCRAELCDIFQAQGQYQTQLPFLIHSWRRIRKDSSIYTGKEFIIIAR